MRVKKPSIRLMADPGDLCCGPVCDQHRAAAQEKVLHVFLDDLVDGTTPQAGLIFDAAGNLYGTTVGGGPTGDGTVFELSPAGGRKLDGEGAVELRQRHGRGRARRWADLRCRRQSLRYDVPWRHFRQRDRVRVDRPERAEPGRRRCCITSTTTARTGLSPWPD